MVRKNKKNNALTLDSYGTRIDRINYLGKQNSIYEIPGVANIATLLFVLIDFICLYTVWNTVQTESAIMVALIAVGCGVCLDVPLAIAGNALKSYHQKMKRKEEAIIVMILSILTFLVTFVFALWFRMETKDFAFDISSSSTMVNTMSDMNEITTTESEAVFVAAMFNGIVPLCTSIASFVISYFSANPISKKIERLKKAIIMLDSNIAQIKQALYEAESIDAYEIFMKNSEIVKKKNYVAACKTRALSLKQTAILEIMRILKGPENIIPLFEMGEKMNHIFESSQNSNCIGEVDYEKNTQTV